MPTTKCRNCDAPIPEGVRHCPECGADSQAKRYDRNNDLLKDENEKLKKKIDELEAEIKKPPVVPPKKAAGDDI